MTEILDRTNSQDERRTIPIKFVFSVVDGKTVLSCLKPSAFNNIERIATASETGVLDVMLVWDNGKERSKRVYFGHWNDGVVE